MKTREILAIIIFLFITRNFYKEFRTLSYLNFCKHFDLVKCSSRYYYTKTRKNYIKDLLSAGSLDLLPLEDFLRRLLPEVKRLVSSSRGLVGVRERELL